MNILQLCKKNPFPANDGESIAILQISKGMVAQGHQVTILAMNTPKHHSEIDELPPGLKAQIDFHFIKVNTSIKIGNALINLCRRNSYHIERFKSIDYQRKLIQLLRETKFDIIQAEGIYLALYLQTIRKYSNAKTILRSHNVEHLIWQRIARHTKNPFKKIYLHIQAKRLKTFELNALNQFDGIASISPIDTKIFQSNGCRIPIADILPGLHIADYPLSINERPIENCCIFGALDWIPNQEGLSWFINQVWPMVHKQDSNLKLLIAGRNSADWIKKLDGNGIEFLGELPDAASFYASHNLFLIPLLSGSGIKIKIIEALAYGKTIVATPVAVEGTGLIPGIHLLQADDAKTFAAAILTCVRDTDVRVRLAKAGSRYVRKKYALEKIILQLFDFYESLN